MKYLNKRDEFLKAIKESKIEDFKINESIDMGGAGPFNNDIPWGDSLVGRLVNAIRRKIGIGINMVRIQPVIKRLRVEFDNIIQYSAVGELSEEDKKKIALVIICTLVREVKLAIVDKVSSGTDEDSDEPPSDEKMTPIKDENYLDEVISVVTDVIQQIGEISDQFGDIDNVDEIVAYLKEVLEKVREMKKKLQKEGQAKGEESSEESTSPAKTYNDNFKAVAQLVIAYKAEKDKAAAAFKAGKEVKPGSQIGKEVTTGEPKLGSQIGKEVEVQNKNISKVMDSYIFEANAPSPVMAPLKKLYDTFIQINPDTVADLQSYLKMSEENQLNDKISGAITRIYTYIRNKQGVKDNIKIKEDLNVLLSNDSKVGDAIIALYSVTKQKEDGSFENISDSLKTSIASFNTSMKNCLLPQTKEATLKKYGEAKESRLLKYNGFRRINEAEDENKDIPKIDEVDVVTYKNQQPILSGYWKELYETKMSKVLLTESKYKEVRKEIDKVQGETKNALTLDGIDPIISVLKLFNRAYKLYTVNSIPGARSGGKISRGVSNEYTPVGGGGFGSGENLSGTDGPYRNNKIFNMWENAVLDIIKERKYQPIFSKRTKLRVGDELKDAAGPIFLKLINELLDGSKLYGSGGTGGKGAQHEFIEKYFGTEAAGDVKPETVSLGGAEETKSTQEIADAVKSTILTFERKEFELRTPDDLKRTIVRLEVEMLSEKSEGEEEKKLDAETELEKKTTEKRYFFVLSLKDDICFVVHSISFQSLLRYIENDFEKKGIEVTFKQSDLRTEPIRKVYLTKMKVRNYMKMLQKGTVVNLVGHTTDNTNNVSIGKQKTLDKKWLCELDEKNQEKKFVLENYSFKNTKGFSLDTLQTHAKETTI